MQGGEVEVALYKGNVTVQRRAAERSRYNRGLVTFEQATSYDLSHPEGFIRMTGLRFRTVPGGSK